MCGVDSYGGAILKIKPKSIIPIVQNRPSMQTRVKEDSFISKAIHIVLEDIKCFLHQDSESKKRKQENEAFMELFK
jgi:hypothetical protein